PFDPLHPVNGPRLVCPYCYSAFPERGILFRCTGLPGPGGHTCSIEKDTALETHLGRNEYLPPVFARDGRRPHAVCRGCMSVTGRHVCPTCHAQLPVGFGRIRGR